MTESFYLPKIETRSIDIDGKPNYIVQGYATTTNHVYPYKVDGQRVFKEYFSERGIKNINRKSQSAPVFIDAMHSTGTKAIVEKYLEDIHDKTGVDISQEKKEIINRIKGTDIPMFKSHEIKIDDNGLFVDLRGNPFYRDIDEEHKNYFDAVWNSLENGFINMMSLNMKPTETIQVNEKLTQIDDADIFGISLLQGSANDMANITEVAMRSLEQIRGGTECQKKMMLR